MDDEEIRKEISDRLEIERQVREQLGNIRDQGAAPKKSRWAWLESKLALLVIGAVITGLLVPTFQYTQERISWHRQNRYDNLERQLESIRESLKQFLLVHSLNAELFNLGLEVIETNSPTLHQSRLEDWRNEFRALRAERIEKNAAFAATMFYFATQSRESIREEWNNLLVPTQKLDTLIGNLLSDTAQGSDEKVPPEPTANEIAVQLDVSIVEADQAYNRVVNILSHQLLEVEDESAKFQ